LRSLVSETPLAAHEYAEVKRHADAITRAREAMRSAVDDLQHRQDELLTHVGTGR
jgi:vacuolar-type H+-ATPase subunit H